MARYEPSKLVMGVRFPPNAWGLVRAPIIVGSWLSVLKSDMGTGALLGPPSLPR